MSRLQSRRRLRLVEAATGLFSVKGYAATRIGDIVEAARTSKPMLYKLFESKEALYRAVLERERSIVRRMVVCPIARDESDDLCAMSLRIVARFWHLQARRPSALPLLLGPRDWRVENDFKLGLRLEIEEAVARGVRIAGADDRPDACPATVAAQLLAFALSTSDLLHHGRADRAGVRAVARHGADLLALSIGTGAGAPPIPTPKGNR